MYFFVFFSLVTVDSRALQIPTVAKVRLLYNNYVADTLVNEHVTAAERAEESSLLDSFMATPVMSTTLRFLSDHGLYINYILKLKNCKHSYALNKFYFSYYMSCIKSQFIQDYIKYSLLIIGKLFRNNFLYSQNKLKENIFLY